MMLHLNKTKSLFIAFLNFAPIVLISFGVNAQWIEKNNGLDGGAVACFATKDNLVFAGTYLGGIYISRTSGDSWKRFALANQGIYSIAINQDKMFAGSWGELYTSTDAGKTWSTANGISSSNPISCLALSDNMILAGTGTKVFYSNDNGTNWATLYSFHSQVRAISFLGSSILVGTDGGLYRSDANGANSKMVNAGSVTSITNQNGKIYVGLGNGVLISSDNGSTWKWSGCGRGAMAIFPFGDTYLSTGYGVYKSSNSGFKCDSIYQGLPSPDVRAAVAIDNSILISVNTSGVFKSIDQGKTWKLSNQGIGGASVNSISYNETTSFVGSDLGVYRSFDNGNTWTATNAGLSGDVVYVACRDTNLFAITNCCVFKSTNNGDTWSSAQYGGYNNTTLALNSSFVFVGTRFNGIYRAPITVSQVGEWTKLLSLEWITALAATSRFVFAGTEKDGALFSEDNGLSWKPLDGIANIKSIDAQGSRVVVSGGRADVLYLSIDFGKSWKPIGQTLPAGYLSMVKILADKIFVVLGGILFYSDDEGISWNFLNNSPPKWPTSLSIKGDTLLAGTIGNGVWAHSASVGYNIVTQSEQISKNAIQIYPNPTTEQLNISLPAMYENSEIEIIAMDGRTIQSFSCRESENHISVAGYPPGIYILQVRSFTHTSRMMFVKSYK